MKNTFAIGTPDKVSRAERDGEVHNRKEKVIEFDLPKGYSAEDAFYSALCHFEQSSYGNTILIKMVGFAKRKIV